MRILLSLFLCCFPVHAQHSADKITALVIDLPPWGYQVDGRIQGFYNEFAQEIGEVYSKDRRWVKIETIVVPYSRAQQLVTQIPRSFTIMSNSAQIKKQALSVGVLLNLDVIALSKPETKLNSIADLEQLNILKIRGTRLTPALSARTWMETTSPLNQLSMLHKNRADAIIGVPQDFAYARTALDCFHKASHDELCSVTEKGNLLPIRQVDVHVWTGKNNDIQFVQNLYEAIFHYKLSKKHQQLLTKIESFK